MGGIFINYRGEDSETAAALIDSKLSARFGNDRVFWTAASVDLAFLVERIIEVDTELAKIATQRQPSTGGIPQQLPAAISHFAGRVDELATLTSLLRDRDGAGGTVVISAIGGTAGVASRSRDRKPIFMVASVRQADPWPGSPSVGGRTCIGAGVIGVSCGRGRYWPGRSPAQEQDTSRTVTSDTAHPCFCWRGPPGLLQCSNEVTRILYESIRGDANGTSEGRQVKAIWPVGPEGFRYFAGWPTGSATGSPAAMSCTWGSQTHLFRDRVDGSSARRYVASHPGERQPRDPSS